MTANTPSRTRATPRQVAGRAAARVAELWDRFTGPAAPAASFDPSMLTGLPEPARRWLSHAIAAGTPMHRTVVLEMEGRIRLGRWLPFRAVQVHAPPDGYIWAARASPHDAGCCRGDELLDRTGPHTPGRSPGVFGTLACVGRAAGRRDQLRGDVDDVFGGAFAERLRTRPGLELGGQQPAEIASQCFDVWLIGHKHDRTTQKGDSARIKRGGDRPSPSCHAALGRDTRPGVVWGRVGKVVRVVSGP